MKLRKQILIFLMLTLATACLLWWLPGPHTIISSEGEQNTNRYWWWLAGGVLVAVGCAFEYFMSETCDIILQRLSRRQKIVAGTLLLSVALPGGFYGLFRYFHG